MLAFYEDSLRMTVVALTPSVNVINIRKPVFRKKLVRLVLKLLILLIIK